MNSKRTREDSSDNDEQQHVFKSTRLQTKSNKRKLLIEDDEIKEEPDNSDDQDYEVTKAKGTKNNPKKSKIVSHDKIVKIDYSNVARSSKAIQDESDESEDDVKASCETNKSADASKASINLFRNSLVSYKTELEKQKRNLQNSSTIKAYETSAEARRKSQLKTEETIAEIKIQNGFDINDDESILPAELKLEIETIQKTNDELIEKTEGYEQTLISESESVETKTKVNVIFADLDEKIILADRYIKQVDAGSLKKKEKLKKARQELNIKPNLKEIQDKINLLPFNAKKLDFVENDQIIGQMTIKETIGVENSNIFRFKELETSKTVQVGDNGYVDYVESFTHQSRLFEIMDNGTFVVGGYVTCTRKFHLFIYDPVGKVKKNEIILDNRIDEIFTFKNKIIFSQRRYESYYYNYTLMIMDENLNLIRQKNTESLLKHVDDTQLYCFQGQRYECYDWNLNKIETNVIFQNRDSKGSFYLESRIPIYYCKIDQLIKRDKKFIINFNHDSKNELLIFSEDGILSKKILISEEFVIDPNNNIIVINMKKDALYYYNFNGEMLKTVSIKRPKQIAKDQRMKIKFDSNGKLYLVQ